MKKIKYCALTTVSGSLEKFILPAMELFAENGYDITLSCAKNDVFKEKLDNKYSFFSLDIERGFNFKKTIKTIITLYFFFRKQKFDMIEYGTENIAFCAAIAGFFARVPIRIYDHWGARYVGLHGLARILSIWIERIAALFSTDVRQVSNKNAELCVEQKLYSWKKVKVLGKGGTIGVDLNKFDYKKKEQYRRKIREEFKIPSDAFIFGYVGRIQRDKGINELLQAFRKLQNDKYYLMLVGNIDGVNLVDEENMIWAENNDHVIFTGSVNDVYRYMAAFDILVHPTYREGFGMVLQEAAAVKTPIITTNIMGPGEFIKDNITGILVEPKNYEKLYIAMQELSTDSVKMHNYAEANYKYVCQYFERNLMIKRLLEDREQLRKRMR